ncbi:MAG: hypothetical protein M0R74_08435 [Dehalococcoidia bacterium]|nr:hypothetical protein [Dehalococcoidia bacterium]
MQDDRPLRDRGRTLEEEFFRKQNEELVARLRTTEARDQAREHLAAATGISDKTVIDSLLDQGVTHATVAALALAPLVAVAWADRRLEEKERRAVLQEAASAGVSAGTPEHELLESWLNQQPPPSLMSTWSSYVREVAQNLEPAQRKEFRDTLLQRCRAIANAAGGFAGLGRLSPEEQTVIRQVEKALEG